MEAQIDQAISSCNYTQLTSIFRNVKQTLGQGEQRTLFAYLIKQSITATPTFLPQAFTSSDYQTIIEEALTHLPTTVENAYDNQIRHALFNFLIDETDEYRKAATILSGMRMESDDTKNVYYTTNAERTDIYVKIAECFLNEEDYVEAETFVTKAGSSVEEIDNPRECVALILRFKSVYARVLDANRKFLQAASRYYDLSTVGNNDNHHDNNNNDNNNDNNMNQDADADANAATDDVRMMIDEEDLLEFLGRAATCAILAPSGPQRQRILGLVHKDERLKQLDTIPHFKTHSSIVTKMYMNQIIKRGNDLDTFCNSLSDHQKAVMSDGLTIEQRALIEHNMVAVSRLYASIYFEDLGEILGVTRDRAENIACKMILSGILIGGTIDAVDGILNFDSNECALVHWDGAITSFCSQLNKVTDAIRQNT